MYIIHSSLRYSAPFTPTALTPFDTPSLSAKPLPVAMSAPDLDLCKIPAGPPPEGITSNFVNPPSLGPPVIAVMSITVAWGALFTAARLYLNFHRLRWTDCESWSCAFVNKQPRPLA